MMNNKTAKEMFEELVELRGMEYGIMKKTERQLEEVYQSRLPY